MLEFKVENEVMPIIKVNYGEVKSALENTLAQYTGIIVTEESLSAAKAEQKTLAGIRVQIDNYRKAKKKEFSQPIADFETQCKELISLVEKAELPIKKGIAVFDDKKKEEKRQQVQDLIKLIAEEHGLNEKYAAKLTIADKYLNLTASFKATKEDLELRSYNLLQEQMREEQAIEIIKTTVDNANADINTKIPYKDYLAFLEAGTTVPQIIARINRVAEMIKEAEKPKEEIAAPIAPITPPVEAPKEVVQEVVKTPEPQMEEVKEHIKTPQACIEMRVIASLPMIAKLSAFLKDNGYNYEVLKKGFWKEEEQC